LSGGTGRQACDHQAPPNSGSRFSNYKKTFSVVLLALVDAHYNFIAVDVGSFEKNNDGGILAHSDLGKALESGTLNIPRNALLPGTTNEAPYVSVGDDAFPLKTYLMRPYPGKQLDDVTKRIYNCRLCRVRRIVEYVFGILSQKFRIFSRIMQSKTDNADFIILATCVLHNFIKKYDIFTCSSTTDVITTTTTLGNVPMQSGSVTHEAFRVREMYKAYFNSEAGSVL
jgi:hypothetical protein